MNIDKQFTPPLMLYDDECPLCNRFKQALDHIPGTDKINKVSIHNQNIYTIYPHLNPDECHETLHVLLEPDKILKGPAAIEYLIGLFPAVAKFCWLYESNMGKKAIDFFYKAADNYRKSKLNRCETCKKSRHL